MKGVHFTILFRLGRDEADVVLIQELRLSRNGISGLRAKGHKFLVASNTGRTRASLLVRNKLKVFLLLIFATRMSPPPDLLG